MTRFLPICFVVCLITLTLLAVAGCAPSLPPAQDPAPQIAVPTTVAAPTVTLINAPVQTQPSLAASASGTPQRVAVPTVKPTFSPHPLNVQVTMDTPLSASAVISTTGGTLSVRDSHGTRFTLNFPKGALSQDTQITLTPVTRVDGLPFSGGLVGGVQMAPEGLRLLQPATLTIESPKTTPEKGLETVAFAYHQNGQGLYLNPSQAEGKVLSLEIWHFSGAGAAQGTSTEIQTQQQNAPSNPEDALAQRVQDYLWEQHQAQQQGQSTDPDLAKQMAEFAREYYDRFIAPQLPIALQDCEAAPEIFSKALGWLRQLQLLGIEKEFQSEDARIRETVNQAIVNCYNKEYEQCVIKYDIKHRTAMIQDLHQAMLLGIADRLDQTKIEKCAPRYRVDQIVGLPGVHLTGCISALDKPFTLDVKGANAAGGTYVGSFKFTPSGTKGGSWTHLATTSCLPELGCAMVAGSGTYQVEELSGGGAKIMMSEATMGTGFGTATQQMAFDFEIKPDTGACNPN